MDLPRLALSVRQPWAWAIIHAGKDIENRDWRAPNPGLKFRGRVAIHASSGMGRDEFEDAIDTIDGIASAHVTRMPRAVELVRGAIIGSVEVVDIVRGKAFDGGSQHGPWFVGPVGLKLADPVPCEPIPCKGQLGFFAWQRSGYLAPPAKWMLPPQPKPPRIVEPKSREVEAEPRERDLFDN